MWFTVNNNFLGKKVQKDNGFYIIISNFKHAWDKFFSDTELYSVSKLCNPLVEAPSLKLKEMILNLIDQNDGVIKELREENNDISLHFQSLREDFKLNFFFTLRKVNTEDVVYEEFIVPLLLVLSEKQKKEEELIKWLIGKDMEIEEYKRANVNIISDLMATDTFHEESFRNKIINSEIIKAGWHPKELLHCISSKLIYMEKYLVQGNEISSYDKKNDTKFNTNEELKKFSGINQVVEKKNTMNLHTVKRKRKVKKPF